MKTVQVVCDSCERDLTYTGNAMGYRLVVASEEKAHYPGGGVVTAMMVYPPVERTHHFCGMKCLWNWMNTQQGSKAG